jgi:RNA polymerase sigma-70 factor (ECF subfamily)
MPAVAERLIRRDRRRLAQKRGFVDADGPAHRRAALTVIKDDRRTGSAPALSARVLDWSILMAHAQSGDREAYRRLLGEIAPYLRAMSARRHRDPGDTEDAVQDILLTLHAIRHTYDPSRPFAPWLVAIANRRLIDRLRRQGRVRSHETAPLPEHETFAADEANLSERALERRDLEAAVEKLSSGQRQAIRLLKLEERSLVEAAAMSGMSVAALKVATHRAIKRLREILGKGSGVS